MAMRRFLRRRPILGRFRTQEEEVEPIYRTLDNTVYPLEVVEYPCFEGETTMLLIEVEPGQSYVAILNQHPHPSGAECFDNKEDALDRIRKWRKELGCPKCRELGE